MRKLEREASPSQPVDGTNLPTPSSWTSDLLSCEMMTFWHGNWVKEIDTVIIVIITHSNMLLLSMPSLFPQRSKASLEDRGTSVWSSDYQITKQRSDLVQLSSKVVARLGPAQCPPVKGSADAAPLSLQATLPSLHSPSSTWDWRTHWHSSSCLLPSPPQHPLYAVPSKKCVAFYFLLSNKLGLALLIVCNVFAPPIVR